MEKRHFLLCATSTVDRAHLCCLIPRWVLGAEPRTSRALPSPYLAKQIVVEFEKTPKAFANFSPGFERSDNPG
jgi:hypothetical protein